MKRAARFSRKASTPSPKSADPASSCCCDASNSSCSLEPRVDARVEQLLGAGVGARRARRESLGERVDLGGEGVVGDQPVDQPPGAPLRGRHALAEQRHLGGAPGADAGRDEDRRAAVGNQADVDEREQEVGRLGGEHEVARERQRAADPDRRPVDGGEHRLGHPPHAGDDRVIALAQRRADVRAAVGRRVEARAQVGAGGERAPGAGDRHGAHAVVAGGQLDRGEQVDAQLPVPRVHALGPVELDPQLGPVGRAAAQGDRLELGQGGGHRGILRRGRTAVSPASVTLPACAARPSSARRRSRCSRQASRPRSSVAASALAPPVVTATAAAAPFALCVLYPRSRARDAAVCVLQMWAYVATYEMPNDDPEALERRVRVAYPVRVDRFIGAGRTPTLRLQRALAHAGGFRRWEKALVWSHWLWFLFPHGTVLYLRLRHPERFPRGAVQVYATFDLGVIGYWAIPTAPPWYAARQGLMDDGRTPQLRRMMVEYGEEFWGSRWAQLYGLLGGNPLAAMPSLHFATSVTAARLLAETGPVAGAARLGIRRHAGGRARLSRRALRGRPGGRARARRGDPPRGAAGRRRCWRAYRTAFRGWRRGRAA